MRDWHPPVPPPLTDEDRARIREQQRRDAIAHSAIRADRERRSALRVHLMIGICLGIPLGYAWGQRDAYTDVDARLRDMNASLATSIKRTENALRSMDLIE